MNSQEHQHVSEVSYVDSIAHRIPSSKEHKAPHLCVGGNHCLQRPRDGRNTSSSWIRLLGITFSSLATAYFLLRCFVLVKERNVVVGTPRSLASEGRRTCEGGNILDKGEGGLWRADGLGGGGVQGQVGGVASGEPRLESLYMPEWQSRHASTSSSAHGGLHARSSMAGQGDVSPKDVSAGEHEQRRNLPSRGRGLAWHPWGQGVSRRGEEELMESLFAEESAEGSQEHGNRLGSNLQYWLNGEQDLWEGRKLPSYAAKQVETLFKRMMEAITACRKLLQVLPAGQGLRLAHSVMRLLALNLGAISVIPKDFEPFRSSLSDTLAVLGSCALRHSEEVREVQSLFWEVHSLIDLIKALKIPRQTPPKTSPLARMKRMRSLIRTAGMTVKVCSLVLAGLSRMCENPSGCMPEHVFNQQLGVLKVVFDIHSRYIAMDTYHRYHLRNCQNRMGAELLLGPQHQELADQSLPSLKQVLWDIADSVRKAGGLLHLPLTQSAAQRTLAGTALGSQISATLNGQPRGTITQGHGNRKTPVEYQPSRVSGGPAPSQEMQGAPRLTSPASPQSVAWQLETLPVQGSYPAFLPHSYYAINHQPHKHRSPAFASAVLGSSVIWVRTPADGSKGTPPQIQWDTPNLRGTVAPSRPYTFEGAKAYATPARYFGYGDISLWHSQQSGNAAVGGPLGMRPTIDPLYRDRPLPGQAAPTPWPQALSDSVRQTSPKQSTWKHRTGGQSIPQHPEPERARAVLAELLRSVITLEDILYGDPD